MHGGAGVCIRELCKVVGECSVSFLDQGLDDVNIFQNTWDRHLKSVHFIARQLVLDERNMKRTSSAAPFHGF